MKKVLFLLILHFFCALGMEKRESIVDKWYAEILKKGDAIWGGMFIKEVNQLALVEFLTALELHKEQFEIYTAIHDLQVSSFKYRTNAKWRTLLVALKAKEVLKPYNKSWPSKALIDKRNTQQTNRSTLLQNEISLQTNVAWQTFDEVLKYATTLNSQNGEQVKKEAMQKYEQEKGKYEKQDFTRLFSDSEPIIARHER